MRGDRSGPRVEVEIHQFRQIARGSNAGSRMFCSQPAKLVQHLPQAGGAIERTLVNAEFIIGIVIDRIEPRILEHKLGSCRNDAVKVSMIPILCCDADIDST